jgi:hypothetical protein
MLMIVVNNRSGIKDRSVMLVILLERSCPPYTKEPFVKQPDTSGLPLEEHKATGEKGASIVLSYPDW